jgi:hypothetical protein
MNNFAAPLKSLRSLIRRVLMCAIFVAAVLPLIAQTPGTQTTTLPGHVLGILPKATHFARNPARENDTVMIEVVLRLSDEAGFKAFSAELEDPTSPSYHKPLLPTEFTARFGPTQEAYDQVLEYLQDNGFTLAVGSNNRRTITVRGTRAQAEKAFRVQIDDYQLGERKFHAVATDPSLPADIAPLILGVGGLSNLGKWQAANAPTPATPASIATAYGAKLTNAGLSNTGGLPPGLNGSGTTIGIIALEDFNTSDISNWLSFAGLPADLINNVHKVSVDGGLSVGPGSAEPVLDVDAVLGIAPGANIQVYGGPWSDEASDFYTIINFAIDNVGFGGTLTDSYYMCEAEITQSDALNLDSLLQGATATGITMFAAAGDYGSSCIQGSSTFPNSIAYPSDAPHAVAVGGTTLHVESDNSYDFENWWSTGGYGGGFGNSMYTSALGEPLIERAVPDVALDADLNTGMIICLATPLASPNCFPIGGTSMSSPMWAGIWSLVNQANLDAGRLPFSAGNGYLTTIPNAFHAPSSMSGAGNDSVHLGMGTPKVPTLVAISGPELQLFGIMPDFGPAAGGTTVTINGQGFLGVKKVIFGGASATHLKVLSQSQLTVESPVAPSAQAHVQVETPAGTSASTSSALFNYVPEITAVNPNQGPLTGGNTVTVTGVGLTSEHGFEYSFGGDLATGVSCSSSTTCTMVVPTHGLGSVQLEIETPFGNSPKSVTYTYGAPSVTSFNPTVGPTTGGLAISISGANLATGMTIEFGTTPVTGVVCVDPNTCSVTSPSGPVGSVHLSATVDDVTSAPSTGTFTFEVFPTITAINPNPAAAGAVVTITGTGFSTTAGQTTFPFFGITVTGTCTSATQCTAVVPDEVDGTAHTTAVTVTVNGNTSLDWVSFSYPGKPTPPPCKGITCN